MKNVWRRKQRDILHRNLSINLPAHSVAKATLTENTEILLFSLWEQKKKKQNHVIYRPRLKTLLTVNSSTYPLVYAANNQFIKRAVVASTLACTDIGNLLLRAWNKEDKSVSSLETPKVLDGSNVFNPFSRNASITFHISTLCTK